MSHRLNSVWMIWNYFCSFGLWMPLVSKTHFFANMYLRKNGPLIHQLCLVNSPFIWTIGLEVGFFCWVFSFLFLFFWIINFDYRYSILNDEQDFSSDFQWWWNLRFKQNYISDVNYFKLSSEDAHKKLDCCRQPIEAFVKTKTRTFIMSLKIS